MTGTAVGADREFDVRLGAELRRVRRTLRLSTPAVHARSGGAFKASVLAAYERGERTITTPALVALCRFYGTNPGDLLNAAARDVSEPAPSLEVVSTVAEALLAVCRLTGDNPVAALHAAERTLTPIGDSPVTLVEEKAS